MKSPVNSLVSLGLDLQRALVQWRRSPGIALFVLATLMLGIGANTTLFSLIDALLLRPLPYPASERLVNLYGRYDGSSDEWSVSLPNALDWGRLSRTLEGSAYFRSRNWTLGGIGGTAVEAPRQLTVLEGSGNLLDFLGAVPAAGRLFGPADDSPSAERVAVLSPALWRQLGGSDTLLDTSLLLDGERYQVVGVLGEGFGFPDQRAAVYVPLRADPDSWSRQNGGLQVLGRLRPGTTLESARRDFGDVSAALAERFPDVDGKLSVGVSTLRQALYGGADTSRTAWTLLASVALVLSIACVNVAHLLRARVAGRWRELAIRTSVGAGRSQLVRQLSCESMVLALLGGGGGVLLAVAGVGLLPRAVPERFPVPRSLHLDWRVLTFSVALTLLVGLAFGVAPAIRASRVDLRSLLAGRSSGQDRGAARGRDLLVVAEVALAAMLLVPAGLTLRSLGSLLDRDPGFQPKGVLTLRIALDRRYRDRDLVRRFEQETRRELTALPSVAGSGMVDFLPLGGTDNFGDYYAEGAAEGTPGDRDRTASTGLVLASAGYLETMGIPLLAGRTLAADDDREAAPVVVVNRTLAERHWPGQSALGRRIQLAWEGDYGTSWRTVVGVIGDVRHQGLEQAPRAEVYVPFDQSRYPPSSLTLVLRSEADPLSVAAQARKVVSMADPLLAVYDVREMTEVIGESRAVVLSRLTAAALGTFAVVALLLAALGLFGVLTASVSQRTYEIGVRAALGADRERVMALVLKQGLLLVALGLTVGSLGAMLLARALGGLLHGVGVNDPVSFLVATLALVGVALAAILAPARRAARVDPVRALRSG